MKNTGYRQRNRKLQYQIAGTILVVACVGFALLYFWQKYDARQEALRQAEQEEQEALEEARAQAEEEDTESASAVVLPRQDTQEQAGVLQEQESANQAAQADAGVQAQSNTSAGEEDLHFNGELSWPVDGDVLISYSMDKTVYFPTLQQYKYNPALIISGKVNDKVMAAARGKVTSIETNAQTGVTVTMDLGDGYQAVYGQLKEVPLATGDVVEAGETIGYISEPTKYYSVEGSNLYFQIRQDGENRNPLDFLSETGTEE
ncbi:MAG: peptidoglycan DD-metalloendopeptidase family protein [Oscillospiraceae bacterium]